MPGAPEKGAILTFDAFEGRRSGDANFASAEKGQSERHICRRIATDRGKGSCDGRAGGFFGATGARIALSSDFRRECGKRGPQPTATKVIGTEPAFLGSGWAVSKLRPGRDGNAGRLYLPIPVSSTMELFSNALKVFGTG